MGTITTNNAAIGLNGPRLSNPTPSQLGAISVLNGVFSNNPMPPSVENNQGASIFSSVSSSFSSLTTQSMSGHAAIAATSAETSFASSFAQTLVNKYLIPKYVYGGEKTRVDVEGLKKVSDFAIEAIASTPLAALQGVALKTAITTGLNQAGVGESTSDRIAMGIDKTLAIISNPSSMINAVPGSIAGEVTGEAAAHYLINNYLPKLKQEDKEPNLASPRSSTTGAAVNVKPQASAHIALNILSPRTPNTPTQAPLLQKSHSL